MVTSVCRCKCGGTIRIFDTRKSALAAASAPGASEILSIVVDGLKKRIDREIGSSLMIPPFGSILKELPYAGEVMEALGRGVRKGAADTLTGLYEMITDPLGTLGGIATLAGIAAVGYGQYTSLPNILMPAPEGYKTPEERLAKFDETFGTNLTDAHEGIKSAVDEKITEFDQADGLGKAEMTAEATGYVMVMIVDAVYGSKCTSKLSKAAKMSKLGRAARASKVGQSIAKLTNKAETLAELLKTAAKNKAKTLWNKLPKTRKRIFWVRKGKWKIVKKYSAKEVNRWWKIEKGYENPPYKPGTVVEEIELLENKKFVRVYDGEISGKKGGWLMEENEIKGLTPKQIQEKFALPCEPKYICDVEVDAGTHLRRGTANEVEGWGKGGGIQYDTMGEKAGTFSNERLLTK